MRRFYNLEKRKALKLIKYGALTLILSGLGFGEVYGQGSGGGSSLLLYSLIATGVILLVWISLSITDNLLQVEAAKRGVNTKKNNFSLFPRFSEIFTSRPPSYIKEGNFYNLKKGHNILLAGEAPIESIEEMHAARYAVKPISFRGIAPIPKLLVEEGQEILAGDALFFDKSDPNTKYVAPVSGEVVEIRRGSKRAITHVIILADKEQKFRRNSPPDLQNCSREELINFMAESGLLVHITERPFDIVPMRTHIPDNIFISTFDTAPLSVPGDILVQGNETAFQKGLDVLAKLTSGKVHLGLSANLKTSPSRAFTQANGVEKHWFKGPHPSGNVGVQIHHIEPIRIGYCVWTLRVDDVITIGEMFLSGRYVAEKIVGLVGSEMASPKLIKTMRGANIGDLLGNQKIDYDNTRVISGHVLAGNKVTAEDFLDMGVNTITAIKEGNYYEMFGWLLPITPRPSVSNTFPNFLFPGFKFEGDTNTHGERRAFVMTGQYEKVLPMDIYVQHVMKAIMTDDFEKMEGLGLVELTEEDVALCEFVCTSKMPLQKILRQGLDMMREQS